MFNQKKGVWIMRIMMIVRVPHAKFNAAVGDGSVESKMKTILDETKPEAAYFTELEGLRAVVILANLEKPSMIPALAEPWFLAFEAKVEFHVVMSPEELGQAGLDKIGSRWA
ncbi:hypothetical protein [Prolixibacter denitrificans]|uniref:Panthothenate synthetase n=2 Tax=Prolixibacter denitrificans TaxID=1541063 RepID=A0ABQ0ZJ46_9BACT|nr:hypothetical protein [Prolixibacter denitrificans]GET21472.1 hypothetical protein JCM18694_17180 [Prolixibacter denitrificans]